MRSIQALAFTAFAAAGVLMAPSPAAAQDCGLGCATCGSFPFRYEGFIWDEWADYDMVCANIYTSWCLDCPFSAAEGAIDQEAIGRAVLSAELYELGTLLTAYRDRLLVADDRNLVAIRGSECNPDALGVWLVVSSEKAAALRASGLTSFDTAAPTLVAAQARGAAR